MKGNMVFGIYGHNETYISSCMAVPFNDFLVITTPRVLFLIKPGSKVTDIHFSLELYQSGTHYLKQLFKLQVSKSSKQLYNYSNQQNPSSVQFSRFAPNGAGSLLKKA